MTRMMAIAGKANAFAWGLALAACTSTTPRWDARFGDSLRTVMAQQIRDPAAAAKAGPADGIDGRAANDAIERYQKSFKDAQPPQANGLATPAGAK